MLLSIYNIVFNFIDPCIKVN